MEHAWCRDPSRDERVRAAEDGRNRPLPTLEQCIEQAKQAAMAAGVKEAFIQSDTGWVPLTREHLRRLEQMIPKSVSASSPVEQENKGDGMRTERVTLEVTHDWRDSPCDWDWDEMLRFKTNILADHESVRVVDDCCLDRINMGEIIRQRDAAIRGRDEIRQSWLRSEESGTRLLAERNAALDDADALRKRVAELEAASGGGEGA